MTEVGRVSVAIEATGLDKAASDMEKLERAGQKAAVAVRASMGSVEKEMLAVERLIAKATTGVTSAIGGLDKTIASGFSQTNAALGKMQSEMARTQTAIVDAMRGVGKASEPAKKSIEDLRAQFNPLYAIGQTYRKQVDDIRAAHAAGALSAAEMGDAIDRAGSVAMASQRTYARLREHVEELGNQTKLTGDQMRNLGYQANDAVTMFMSGASPFQILATQAGQVVQALQDGPGGVKGSLEAIKASAINAARAIGPIGLALGGATIAAGALYFAIRDKVEPIDDVIKRQAASVRDLRDAYNLVAPAAEDAGRRSAAALKFETTEQSRKDLERLRAEVQTFYDEFEMVLQDQPGSPEMYAPLRKVFADLKASAEDGIPRFVEAREELAKIAETDPTKGFLGFGTPVREFAKLMLDAAKDGATLQSGLQGVQDELTEVAARAREAGAALNQARSDMAGFLPEAKTQAEQVEAIYQRQSAAIRNLGGDDRDMQSRMRQASEDRRKAMAELSRSSIEQAKAARDALDNLSLSPDQRGLAEIRQRYDAEIAELQRTNGAEEALAAKRQERADAVRAAEVEIGRAEEARRAGYDLDLRAVSARAAAEKAAVEAERVRIDLIAEGYSAGEAAARAEEVRVLSLAQAREQLAESTRQRGVAEQQALDYLHLEIDSIGKTAGEVAALSEEYRLLAEAKERAYQEGRSVTDDEVAAIKAQAAAIGDLNQQLAEKRLLDDIMSERAGLGLSDDEREIFDTLKGAGLDIASSNGQWLASQIRVNQEMERTRDLTKDTFKDFLNDLRSGTSLLGALGNAFANFSTKMADRGMDMLVDQMMGFGAAGGGGSSGGRGLQQVIQAATSMSGRTSSFSSSGSYGFSMPTAKIAAGDFAQASGQMMQYAGRFNSSVDGRLLKILNTAASRFDMRVEAISGLRPGDKRFHGKGLATDVQIYGANGQALGNYQDASTFRTYERFAQLSRQVQQELFPELEGMLRWGGYFSGGKGKYGALDTMHFDLGGGRVGMGGGSWEGGLNATMRRLWSGAESVGMGAGGSQDALARAVATGYVDGTRKIASGGVPGLDPWGGGLRSGANNVSPMVQGGAGGQTSGGFFQSPLFQGGMTALGAGMAGYQSGSPLGGAFSGAMAGLATGNPIMAGIGAVSGLIGGLLGRSKQKKQEEEARKQKEAQQAQQAAQLASQIENLESYFNRSPDSNMASELRSVDQKIRELRASIKNDGIASEGQVDQIERDALTYKELLKEEFRAVFETVTAEFGGGLGLETDFTKARDAIQALGKEARGYVEDTEEAFRVPTELRDAILADYKKAERAASTGYNAATRTADRVRRAAGDEYLDTERQDAERAVIAARKEMDAALKSAATERDKALAEYEASVAEAQRRRDAAVTAALEAGREAILRAISGNVIEQSDAEKALAQQRGAAIQASAELQRLGLSAEEAGVRIKAALAEGSAKMRTDYERGVREEIEELDGRGYMGDVRALLEKRESLRKDAGLLGSDPALADELFAKRAQSIVDGADLTVEAFDKLIAAFPDLASVVRRVSVDLEAIKSRIEGYDDRRFAATTNTSTLAGAMADFERRATRERQAELLAGGGGMLALNAAQSAEKVAMIQALLVQARQDEISEIEATISRLEGLSSEWSDLRKSLKLDDTLSPLNQRDQALEAQRVFRENAAKAAAGDVDAQAKQAQYAQSYLEEFKAYYASSEDYYAAFQEVQGVLETAETLADQQLKAAQSQLDVAKKQLDAMIGVKDSVTTLQEALTKALAELAAAMKTNAALTPGVVSGGQTVVGSGAGAYTTGNTSTGSNTSIPTGGINGVSRQDFETWGFLGTQYQAILGRGIKDRSELDYYTNLRNQGWTADDIIAAIKASPEAKARGYAFGGLVSGPGTGTSDSIMARLSAGEFVMPARAVTPQTLPMLEGMRSGRMAGNDNAEMIAELRGLRAEVRSLRATVAEGELANVAATRAGVAAQQAAAVEQKKAASR